MSRFTTVIPTQGSSGNIYMMVANAVSLMKQLHCTRAEVDELRLNVINARSYEEACAFIREWFPLQGDE